MTNYEGKIKMKNIWILAQAETDEGRVGETRVDEEEGEATTVATDPNAPPDTRRPSPFGGSTSWIFIGLMFVIMYFLLFRGPRKKQQQHKQMVQTLRKNDKVRTIGGIIGTVVDIKGDEVTLKVDESTNTKIKIASSAIGRNLSQD